MQLTKGNGDKFTRPSHQRDASDSDKFRFNHSRKTFSQQYAKFYETRLEALSCKLEDASKEKWGECLLINGLFFWLASINPLFVSSLISYI